MERGKKRNVECFGTRVKTASVCVKKINTFEQDLTLEKV